MPSNLPPSVIPDQPSQLLEIAEAINHIIPLHGLSYREREWLARHGQEIRIQSGDTLFEEGMPAEQMILILKGEIHVRRQRTGPMALFIGRAGQMTGLLPFSRMTSYGGQGFAVQPVWALLFHKSMFPEMMQAIPSFGQRAVNTLLDRVREVTRIEQQSEKLTALGKLAGNLAHELNNPSSAAQRAASGILTELRSYGNARYRLVSFCLTADQVLAVKGWERRVRASALESQNRDQSRDQIDSAVREDQILRWIEQHGIHGGWQIAPELAELGVEAENLQPLAELLPPDAIQVVLEQFASALRAEHFAQAMLHSTDRIFDLISAIKTYSYMDRAPILDVDVPAGLDATLQMLHSRMQSIRVIREFEPDLPSISAYGSELNQVWTALIENALEAMHQAKLQAKQQNLLYHAFLRLVCRLEADMLLVEVWDNGPGIPAELQDRIFEPFFTTKAPGLGLGLGLDNAMRIVRKHRGHLGVHSEPNATGFHVRLPLNQLQAY
uniref:Sensor protein n=1 Tax=mine drainage metagenome TaxID=410659 RepID=E6QI91_9ZZZZ